LYLGPDALAAIERGEEVDVEATPASSR